MNIIVIVEYVRTQAWRKETLGVGVINELVAHGHDVTVLCDAIEDEHDFHHCAAHDTGSLTIEMRRPNRKRNDTRSLAFASWVRSRVTSIGRDSESDGTDTPVVVSLTPAVCAQVWLPIARDPRGALRRVFAPSNPLSMMMECARERSEISSILACSSAYRSMRAGRIAHALPMIAADKTSCTQLRIGQSDGSVQGVGFASPLSSRHTQRELIYRCGAARSQLRVMLDLPENAQILAMSLCKADLDALDALFAGLSKIERSRRPSLVIAGSLASTIDRLAYKHGVQSTTKLIGPTEHMDRLLLGADIAVHPGSIDPPRAPLGRFIADAIYCDTTVIAGPNAPGHEMVRHTQGAVAGVLDSHDAALWASAIANTLGAEPETKMKRAHETFTITDVSLATLVASIETHLAIAMRNASV